MTSTTHLTRITERFRVPAEGHFDLSDVDPDKTPGIDGKKEAREILSSCQERLEELQNMLYAQAKHAVLIVLQAMDTGGKDGTIRRVFGPLNPQGVRVTSFKAPTAEELAHDYLWRIHKAVPARGMIGIFNRSHYEDVLIVRVHNLAPRKEVDRRYEQINHFESYLAANRVTILKFFLHISRDEQRERLERRLERPDKHWKFNPDDLGERKLWDDYMKAFETMLRRCSTSAAPWYVIPADHKWYRDALVAATVLQTLERLDLAYPDPAVDISGIRIDD